MSTSAGYCDNAQRTSSCTVMLFPTAQCWAPGSALDAKMGSFCVFSYSLNRISGDYESSRRAGLSADLPTKAFAAANTLRRTSQRPVGAGRLSVETQFAVREGLVAMGLILLLTDAQAHYAWNWYVFMTATRPKQGLRRPPVA